MRLNSHFTKLLRSFVAPFIGVEPLIAAKNMREEGVEPSQCLSTTGF